MLVVMTMLVLEGRVEMPPMKARPLSEVVAAKAARGDTTMSPAELALLEDGERTAAL